MSKHQVKAILRKLEQMDKSDLLEIRRGLDNLLGGQVLAEREAALEYIRQYVDPVYHDLHVVNKIEGAIIGIALAGTQKVASSQIKTFIQLHAGAIAGVEAEMARAREHGIKWDMLDLAKTAPGYHRAMVDLFSGKDENGKRLRKSLSEIDPMMQHLADTQRQLGPGQKAGPKQWRLELANRWTDYQILKPDATPGQIRQFLREEIATYDRDLKKWKLKPDHKDKVRWLDSLNNTKDDYAYQAWLLSA